MLISPLLARLRLLWLREFLMMPHIILQAKTAWGALNTKMSYPNAIRQIDWQRTYVLTPLPHLLFIFLGKTDVLYFQIAYLVFSLHWYSPISFLWQFLLKYLASAHTLSSSNPALAVQAPDLRADREGDSKGRQEDRELPDKTLIPLYHHPVGERR